MADKVKNQIERLVEPLEVAVLAFLSLMYYVMIIK